MTKVCQNCKTVNPNDAKFCEKCGKKLSDHSNASNSIKKDGVDGKPPGWWKKQSSSDKKLIIGGFFGGIFLFALLMIILFPVTALDIDQRQITIDNQTTECIIQGRAEPNATVKITAPILNLNDTVINVDNNGNFNYKVFIPLNVTETDVNITAKSPNKHIHGEITVNIKREATSPAPAVSNTVPESTSTHSTSNSTSAQSTTNPDDGTGYVTGDNEALIAINDGDPNEYLPDLGGHYPDIVNGEPDSWLSDYKAGYIDRLKQEGLYYPE